MSSNTNVNNRPLDYQHGNSSSQEQRVNEDFGNGKHLSQADATERTPLLNNNATVDGSSEHSEHESKIDIFRKEAGVLLKFALPIFGTYAMQHSLLTVSAISIGHVSTKALAAASLGVTTASVTAFSVIQGFVSALDTLLPPAWTSPEPHLVGLWSQRMTVLMSILLIPIYFLWFNAEPILLFLKQDPEVAHLASIYLRWLSLSLPAYVFNVISRRYFQSQGLLIIPTTIIMVVVPVNMFFNWILVWGPDPVRLGFIGAPIAITISYNLIAIITAIYGVVYAPKAAWYPLSRRMFFNLGILMRLGLSGVAQIASEWWAWEIITLAASLFGPVALASQSVLVMSSSTTFQAPMSLSMATAVRIGNLLGEGNAKQASITAKTAFFMTLIIMSILSIMFIIFRYKWAYIFNSDPEVVNLVASIMPILALFQVFDGLAGYSAGNLRAIGKQYWGALINLSAYYVIGIPLSLYLAFNQHMKLQGLWIGVTFSLVYTGVIGCWISSRIDWNLEALRAAERLKEDDPTTQAQNEPLVQDA